MKIVTYEMYLTHWNNTCSLPSFTPYFLWASRSKFWRSLSLKLVLIKYWYCMAKSLRFSWERCSARSKEVSPLCWYKITLTVIVWCYRVMSLFPNKPSLAECITKSILTGNICDLRTLWFGQIVFPVLFYYPGASCFSNVIFRLIKSSIFPQTFLMLERTTCQLLRLCWGTTIYLNFSVKFAFQADIWNLWGHRNSFEDAAG